MTGTHYRAAHTTVAQGGSRLSLGEWWPELTPCRDSWSIRSSRELPRYLTQTLHFTAEDMKL